MTARYTIDLFCSEWLRFPKNISEMRLLLNSW
ncbi:hypothetical protein LSS_22300 [Leptospira santarosai serovar Shermani str. LT 821]|uniref:Uncharacterized protein n=1 Tax=Leptospira santarosai serovar Shermani str. LT 821 TaxID=758847 RepID=A0A097ESS6_9LEPT|nr:hypothetical protein LSS_22300 [Leptospira santarosai serovar Shermani str. LT 821]